MKSYHDIIGDGGSGIIEQVVEQRARIADGLAGVRHLVAVGSGKGGVGKSTLTLHLAMALRAMGLRIAILDADFNGPSQARMAGVEGALFVLFEVMVLKLKALLDASPEEMRARHTNME